MAHWLRRSLIVLAANTNCFYLTPNTNVLRHVVIGPGLPTSGKNLWARFASGLTLHRVPNKRPVKQKSQAPLKIPSQEGLLDVVAFATAEEYKLEHLSEAVCKQGNFMIKNMPSDVVDACFVTDKSQSKEKSSDIIIFRQGVVVFFNMPTTEQELFLNFVRRFEEDAYDIHLRQHESEKAQYGYSLDDSSRTKIVDGAMIFGVSDDVDLEKYSFANGLMLSVKLGIWEACLSEYIDSIEDVTETLKEGGPLLISRKDVLKKAGELFNLSHMINLSSDLLDSPDFYWDRDELEKVYRQTIAYLNVPHRVKVMNHKLSHCIDLVNLLRDHLNTTHEVRLEWMIIILIMVEVVFEMLHLAERHQQASQLKTTPEADS